MTAEQIIENVTKKVLANEPISPGYWVEAALRVNQLTEDLDNQIASIKAMMNEIQAEYMKQDMAASKAKVLAQADVDYSEFLKKQALRKRIDEWIMLAKKRAVISI